MIHFRSFLNSDTPHLADVWMSEPPLRAMARPMSVSLFDQFVFSKLYFDRHGLVVAEEVAEDLVEEVPRPIVGFAHAGFGPNDDESWTNPATGVVSMVAVRPRDDADAIANGLLARCEQFLRNAGSTFVYAGGYYPFSPFYLGLYGGSQSAGILVSDERRMRWIAAAGYQPERRRRILQHRLAELSPVSNRQQLMIRRRCRLEVVMDPKPETWWQANRAAQHQFTRFQLVPCAGGSPLAWMTAWDLEPLATSWGRHATGLLDIELAADRCEPGMDTFLLCESLRHLQSLGVTIVESHVAENDAARLRLLEEAGFREIDSGVIFGKSLALAAQG